MGDSYIPEAFQLPDGTLIDIPALEGETCPVKPKDVWSGFHDTDKNGR